MSASGKKTASAKRPAEHRFVLKLMRPIFQTAVIAVDARTEKQAIARAFREAKRLSEKAWEGGFNRRYYAYNLQHVLDATDALAEPGAVSNAKTETALIADLRSWGDTRYMILKADIESGEGDTHAQPWLRRCSDLMVADLGMDWVEQLEPVQHKGIDGYRGLWGEDWRPATDERRDNVVPLRKSNDEDDDPDDPDDESG